MASKKILVIDDEQEIRNVIRDYLEEQGYEILDAPNGRDGLQIAKTAHPDLILLDVEMPDMNGYEVCRQIRGVVEIQHTPIIMLTAHTQEKEELNGFRSGADDYIPKPFKPVRLLARINTAIDRNLRELDANALTHLPGNHAIVEEIQRRIETGMPFSVLYFDLNNFKAFNDRYGFVRGDEAIRLIAKILTEAFAAVPNGHPFIGHVGGDDFVGLIDSHEVGGLCESIIQKFNQSIRALYDEEDRKRGKIESQDRKGNKIELPLMGVAIAVVTNRQKNFKHPGEIALIAGDLKKWVKSASGSAYVIDRRT